MEKAIFLYSFFRISPAFSLWFFDSSLPSYKLSETTEINGNFDTLQRMAFGGENKHKYAVFCDSSDCNMLGVSISSPLGLSWRIITEKKGQAVAVT